jgi:hypothetical protein
MLAVSACPMGLQLHYRKISRMCLFLLGVASLSHLATAVREISLAQL